MSIITIDIETAPSQLAWARDEIASTVKPPGTLKKPESIAEWVRESKPAAVEEAYAKTSFDGGLGQILCVAWAVNDAESQVISVDEFGADREADILSVWFDALLRVHSGTSGMRPTIVGHNVISFDLAFIWKRAMVHGLRPPGWFPRNPKPWSDSVFDTMTQWAGDRERISLDRLCKVLGIEGKGDGPTGADVWPMAQEGRFDEIAEYCRQDVERTRAIYRKMNFMGAA
jgi:predicted PolB exonuclease-like 3'-5' exonuclease